MGIDRARALRAVDGFLPAWSSASPSGFGSQRRRVLRRGRRGSLTQLASWRCPGLCASSPLALPVANWRPGGCRNGSSQNCRFWRTYRHHERLGHCRLGNFFFFRYVDWLRGGQEEEEEVLSDTVKVVAFSFGRATLCAMRSDRPGPALALSQHPV